MKHLKTLLTTIATLLCSVTINAHDFEVDGIYYNIIDSEKRTVEVTYKGNSSDAYSDEYYFHETIPSTVTYGGVAYKVTAIGEKAFLSCKGVTGITIPNSVTIIGDRAFSYCTKLSDISLPNSIKTIGGYAFNNCESLTTITIPENVTTIREGAFSGCTNLAKYIFNATNMTSAVGEFEYGISEIFYGCNKLTTIIIGNNVKTIPSYAFWQCNKITKITIPENVTSIGDNAFALCSSLREVTFNAKNCTSVGSSDNPTFEGCSYLATIKIGENVEAIPINAFTGCTKITSITIPNSVTYLGSAAFSGCTGLKSITLPNTLKTIASSLFVGCTNLSYITIPNTVTRIENAAFSGCSALTNITIPNSVTDIGSYAFSGCTSITEIDIPASITEISAGIFRNCSNLTKVTIPNTVTSIGTYAFEGCSQLTNISIPNSVMKIYNRVFEGCTSLTNVVIPNSVTTLGDAFYGCTGLTNIVIPNSITEIGICTFRDCTNLKSVTIPNSVTSIGWAAFSNCSSLTSIMIPESVKEIESDVFHSCSALTEVTCKSTTPVTVSSSEFYGVPTTTATLYVPKGSKNAYASATGWSKFQNIIEFSLIPEYTITYMVDGEKFHSETIEQGAEIPIIDAPVKEGHTFIGWENMPSNMPDKDITVYAKFTPNNYIVTFNANGKVVYSEPLAYGTTIIAPDAPEIECYAFVEWENLLKTVPAHDVEFIAIYKQVGVKIVDGISSFSQDVDVSFETISYTRTFNNTNWQALYVPFAMSYEDWAEEFDVAKINDIHQFDEDGDDVLETTKMEIVKVKSGTLKANHPYMIRAKSTGEKTITVENATLMAAETKTIDCSSVELKYTFTGTYETVDGETMVNNNYYAMSGGGLKPTTNTNASLKPFRWYMQITDREGQVVQDVSEVKVVVRGEDDWDATGIDEIETTGNTFVIHGIDGRMVRKVNANTLGEATEGLASGMYVINGKKHIVNN